MTEVFLVAASTEEDAALVALRDISQILVDQDEGCIIGGHMTSILTARYPSQGFVDRRTGDADAGIPLQLAQSGSVHEALLHLGYEAQSGNRYLLPGSGPRPTIDVLVPSWSSTFESSEHGGRAFDAMPGLPLALTSPLVLDVLATMQDRSEQRFATRVPTVESAVVLKANAWASRMSQRDGVDLHNLMCIVRAGHEIGSWRLDEPGLTGARMDAARHLHSLADAWETRPPNVMFDSRLLVANVRRYVTRVAR